MDGQSWALCAKNSRNLGNVGLFYTENRTFKDLKNLIPLFHLGQFLMKWFLIKSVIPTAWETEVYQFTAVLLPAKFLDPRLLVPPLPRLFGIPLPIFCRGEQGRQSFC